MSQFLITTADERSWKFDRPVLFLGEWCRKYDRKHIWAPMNAVVATPYGLGEKKKDSDYAYVEKLTAELLVELANILNIHHGTDHSLRYWRILLGHWLHRSVAVIFNRFFSLEQAISKYEVTSTAFVDGTSYSLAPPDPLTFLWTFTDDVWNEVLWSKILQFLPQEGIHVETFDAPIGSGFRIPYADQPSLDLAALKGVPVRVLRKILPLLSKKRDALIINSALPAIEQVKLQLCLGQVPQFWGGGRYRAGDIKADLSLRKRLSLKVSSEVGFGQCVRGLLLELLPICYLEGYQQLNDETRQLAWPSCPKFIFTSNSFDTDPLFKAWAASRVEEGVPYYTGQHGNHYGTFKYNYCETECVATSDRFLTWGWRDGSAKHFPAFVFTRAGQKVRQAAPTGGLLLIEVHSPIRENTWDEYAEFQLYQNEQFDFVEGLPEYIRRELTVRLHGAHKQLPWCEEQRWHDRAPSISIDNGTMSIRDLIAKNRLVVHSYDSTGILETLSQNIPTLCFWQGDLSHVRESARPYYEKLLRAGIVQNSANLAAKKVVEIWNDIPSWWGSENVQSARHEFCAKYAISGCSPATKLKNLLLGAGS